MKAIILRAGGHVCRRRDRGRLAEAAARQLWKEISISNSNHERNHYQMLPVENGAAGGRRGSPQQAA